MRPSVVVGLSGGVDSFVTALLLKQQGYDVIGVYLQLWGDKEKPQLDCLCRDLGIELLRYDGQELFRRQVVDVFVQEYSEGRTPNPCALCNNTVKWSLLLQVADELRVEKVATGHYVKILPLAGHWYVCKGEDAVKDQSYFLWGVKEKLLMRALTPLGDFTKVQVKKMAQDYGYADLAYQKESMGICFLEGKDYRDFIFHYSGRICKSVPGDIRDTDGHIIGQHTGLLNYTVGQKRGMPVIGNEPLYVKEICAGQNLIVADRKNGLFQHILEIGQVNLIDRTDLESENIEVKVRGLGLNPTGSANVREIGESRLRIYLENPAWALAPGQPVALYCGNRLLGGGILSSSRI